MIFTLFWKELREHCTVWVAMAAFSVLLLVGLAFILDPQTVQLQSTVGDWRIVPVGWATVVLAVTYGLVCGAMMFAGEREGRTLAFLDGLPSLRFEIWATKVVTGMLLTLAQSGVLWGIVTFLNLPPGGNTQPIFWAVVLPIVGCLAYSCGLFGSSIAGSVLGAIGVGVIPLLLGGIVFSSILAAGTPISFVGLSIPFIMAIGGVLVSGYFFTSPDWERWQGFGPREPVASQGKKEGPVRPPSHRSSFPWLAMFWLTCRQGWPELICYTVLALMLGLMLPSLGWIFWPIGTLFLGVLCGTAVFRPDQEDRGFKFLGDQRLPAWQVWLTKIGFWGVAAVGLSLLFLIAALVHIALALSGTTHMEALESGRGYLPGGGALWMRSSLVGYAGLWLLHGFAIGQLSSLIWRKTAVSVVLAMLTAPMVAALWMPSLIGGGVSWWQVLAGPLVLLVATLLVEKAWLSDRLASFRPATVIVVAIGVALVWLGGNLAWRWIELPDVGEPFDVGAFEKTVFTDDQGEARSLLSLGGKELVERESQLKRADESSMSHPMAGGGAPGMAPGGMPPGPGEGGPGIVDGDNPPMVQVSLPDPHPEETLKAILKDGWKASTPRFERWLDRMFETGPEIPDWVRHYREVARQPPSTVFDCRSASIQSNIQPIFNCSRAGQLFALRGMHHLACGEESDGVDCLAVALALSRHLRHKAIPLSWVNGDLVEKTVLTALIHWLHNDACEKEAILRAKGELDKHEAALPPVADSVKAAYLTMQNTLTNPSQMSWLLEIYDRTPTPSAASQLNSGLTLTAVGMPWEKDRLERLLNVVGAGWLRAADLPSKQVALHLQLAAITPNPYVRLMQPWVPSTRGPDAGITPERVADDVKWSLLRECMTPVKNVFEGRIATVKLIQEARDAIAQALEAAGD